MTAGPPTADDHGEWPTAAEVFTLSLRPRPGGRLRYVLRIAGAFAAQFLASLVPSLAVHDVVVTRRADGEEVLRLPPEDVLSEGDLLAHMRQQMEGMDEETFLAEWRSKTAG